MWVITKITLLSVAALCGIILPTGPTGPAWEQGKQRTPGNPADPGPHLGPSVHP